jgi:hypothetical protein
MASDTISARPRLISKIIIYVLNAFWIAVLLLYGAAIWHFAPTLGALALILLLIGLLIKGTLWLFPAIGEWWLKHNHTIACYSVSLIVAAIWGALLWYFAPEQGRASKPLGSLTLSDLGGLVFWFCLLIGGVRVLFAMLERD